MSHSNRFVLAVFLFCMSFGLVQAQPRPITRNSLPPGTAFLDTLQTWNALQTYNAGIRLFPGSPPNSPTGGMLYVDSSNGRLYFHYNGTFHLVETDADVRGALMQASLNGTDLSAWSKVNFAGPSVNVSMSGTTMNVTIDAALEGYDEGVDLGSFKRLNVVGTGLTAGISGGTLTITQTSVGSFTGDTNDSSQKFLNNSGSNYGGAVAVIDPQGLTVTTSGVTATFTGTGVTTTNPTYAINKQALFPQGFSMTATSNIGTPAASWNIGMTGGSGESAANFTFQDVGTSPLMRGFYINNSGSYTGTGAVVGEYFDLNASSVGSNMALNALTVTQGTSGIYANVTAVGRAAFGVIGNANGAIGGLSVGVMGRATVSSNPFSTSTISVGVIGSAQKGSGSPNTAVGGFFGIGQPDNPIMTSSALQISNGSLTSLPILVAQSGINTKFQINGDGTADFKQVPSANFAFENRSTDPSSPVGGQAYWKTTTAKLRIYDAVGAAWTDVGSGGGGGGSFSGDVSTATQGYLNNSISLAPVLVRDTNGLSISLDDGSGACNISVSNIGSPIPRFVVNNHMQFATGTQVGIGAVPGAGNLLYVASISAPISAHMTFINAIPGDLDQSPLYVQSQTQGSSPGATLSGLQVNQQGSYSGNGVTMGVEVSNYSGGAGNNLKLGSSSENLVWPFANIGVMSRVGATSGDRSVAVYGTVISTSGASKNFGVIGNTRQTGASINVGVTGHAASGTTNVGVFAGIDQPDNLNLPASGNYALVADSGGSGSSAGGLAAFRENGTDHVLIGTGVGFSILQALSAGVTKFEVLGDGSTDHHTMPAKRFVVETGTSDPGSDLVAGRLYWRSDLKQYEVYTGTVWQPISSGQGSGYVDHFLSQAGDFTITSSSSSSQAIGDITATPTAMPAGYLKIGTRVHIHAEGTYSAVMGNVGLRFGFASGSTTTTAPAQAGLASTNWVADLYMTCRSTGVSGTVEISGTWTNTDSTTLIVGFTRTLATIDTTSAQTCHLGAQVTSSNGSPASLITKIAFVDGYEP